MSNAQPPRFASWLLTRFASGPQSESMMGDLVEQYRSGRSAAWYWRQVVSAVLAGAGRDLRTHKLLTLRAVAFGSLLYFLLSFPVNWLSVAARVRVIGWLAETGRYSYWSVLLGAQLSSAIFVYLACVLSGWIVGRLHSRHSMAMVSVYALSVFVLESGMIAVGFATQGHPPMPLAALMLPMALAMGRPISILAGGLMAAGGDTREVVRE